MRVLATAAPQTLVELATLPDTVGGAVEALLPVKFSASQITGPSHYPFWYPDQLPPELLAWADRHCLRSQDSWVLLAAVETLLYWQLAQAGAKKLEASFRESYTPPKALLRKFRTTWALRVKGARAAHASLDSFRYPPLRIRQDGFGYQLPAYALPLWERFGDGSVISFQGLPELVARIPGWNPVTESWSRYRRTAEADFQRALQQYKGQRLAELQAGDLKRANSTSEQHLVWAVQYQVHGLSFAEIGRREPRSMGDEDSKRRIIEKNTKRALDLVGIPARRRRTVPQRVAGSSA